MDMNERAKHEYQNDGLPGYCGVCALAPGDPIHYAPATLAERKRDEALAAAGLDPEENIVVIDRTPNVGITNPNIRLWIGVALFILSLLSAIAAITLSNFPELEIGDAVVSRSIVLVNQIISLLTGAFGLAFVSPNVPTKP